MPELPEVECYRRLAASAVGRRIEAVHVFDPHCLAPPATSALLASRLEGARVTGARRRGKLLALDVRRGRSEAVLGMRFGMTGVLVVDGRPGIDRLLYAPREPDVGYLRFRLDFAASASVALSDPRRFGRVSLDPDEEALGPDALSVTLGQLRAALAVYQGPGPALKARLNDQSRLAGLGNLSLDEILWRAGLSPLRPCGSLSDEELVRLQRTIRSGLRLLVRRGGSHTGDLMAERHADGRCPRDGASLERAQVGGRSTWWCPRHQG